MRGQGTLGRDLQLQLTCQVLLLTERVLCRSRRCGDLPVPSKRPTGASPPPRCCSPQSSPSRGSSAAPLSGSPGSRRARSPDHDPRAISDVSHGLHRVQNLTRARALQAKPHAPPFASARPERPAGTRRLERRRHEPQGRHRPPAPARAWARRGQRQPRVPARASQSRGRPAVMRPPGWFPPLRLRSAPPRARGPRFPGRRRREAGPRLGRPWTRGIPGLTLGDPEATSLLEAWAPGLRPLHRHPSSQALPRRPPPPKFHPGARAPTPVSPALPVLQHFHVRRWASTTAPPRRPLAFLPQTCSSSLCPHLGQEHHQTC